MTRTLNFPYNALQVTAEDLERQIGYASGGSLASFSDASHEVLKDAERLVDVCAGYRVFDAMDADPAGHTLRIGSTTFHPGPVILQQLTGSTGALVFACTAGEAITQEARQWFSGGDPLKGYLYDILGSVCVEKGADLLEAEACKEMEKRGLHISRRLSPGYCGWNVAEQNRLFTLLPEGFCGIRVSASSLMHPIKSVSGIVGFGTNAGRPSRPCRQCEDVTCTYNRRPGNEKGKQFTQ